MRDVRAPQGVYPPNVKLLAVECIRSGMTDAEARREVYRQTGYTVGPQTATNWATR